MSTIARRIRATPERPATKAWEVIVELVSESEGVARKELDAASGVASSQIADETPKDFPILLAGVGPRLRIYCLYGEDATTGDDADESSLSWNPTEGDWKMSIPVHREDLEWVKRQLASHGQRITAYELELGEPEGESAKPEPRKAISINQEEFKKL